MSPADDDNENPWDVKGDNANSSKKPKKTEDSGPFGRGNSSNQTPEFSNIINEFQRRFKETRASGGGGAGLPPQSQWVVFAGIFGLIFLVWAASGFYKVEEGAIAVVLRFGKMVRTAQPGLRYRLPSPIEHEIVKKVAVVNQIDSNAHDGDTDQSLILTGDENMVLTNYTIMWKISDITNYLFMVRNPEATIKAAAESALREIIGQTTAVKALTDDRDLIGNQIQDLLQKILDNYNSEYLHRIIKLFHLVSIFHKLNHINAFRYEKNRK